MSEEPFSELDPNRIPKYEFKDGHFYCDGIRVQPSQMTPEEIRRFIPKSYWTAYFRGKYPCPLDGCEYLFDPGPNLKRSWTGHFRSCHKQWYAVHGREMQSCEDYGQLAAFVDGNQSIDKGA
jgi:hypothetical protein